LLCLIGIVLVAPAAAISGGVSQLIIQDDSALIDSSNATVAKAESPSTTALPADQPVAEPESLIAHITLNMMEGGDYFLQSLHGDLLLERETLKQIGMLPPFPADDGQQQWLSLQAMAPKVTYQFDTVAGTLAIQADPSLLPKHEQSLSRSRPFEARLIQDNALFLNYDVNYNQSRGSKAIISAPLELGMNWRGISLINNLTWQSTQPVQRTRTRLVYDQPEQMRRWAAGDIQASAGSRIGGASLGGVRIFSNFGLKPGMFTGPPLDLTAQLDTPSAVEVRIDDQTAYKGSFPAGELKLRNIPYYRSGLGRAEIIVRDAFGRETTLGRGYYTSERLLAPGLHAYDYAVGKRKLNNAGEDVIYGSSTLFYGTHRYGLTNWLTPGIGLETDGRDIRGGLMADLVLGQWGALGVVAAGSERKGVRGGNVQLDYSYSGIGLLSPGAFISMTTRHYGGLLDALTQSPEAVRWRSGANLSIGLGQMGSMSGRWSQSHHFDGASGQDASLIFSTTLPWQVSLTAEFTRSWQQHISATNQTNVNMGYGFDNGLYLSANYSRSNKHNIFSIQLQMSPPLSNGFGYSASADMPDHQPASTRTSLQYNGNYGELNISRSGTSRSPFYAASLSGSVLLAGQGVHIGRPIRNSFALLKVHGMPHVKVKVQNQFVGETDASGELLLPYLNAYSENRVSIDASEIPLGYNIDSDTQLVSTSYRGGGVVEFSVKKMHILGGKAWYSSHGRRETAQYSGLEFGQGAAKKNVVVGMGGEIYLENIASGHYPAKLFNAQGECRFTLVIPETDEIMTDLGDIVCDRDKQEEKHE